MLSPESKRRRSLSVLFERVPSLRRRGFESLLGRSNSLHRVAHFGFDHLLELPTTALELRGSKLRAGEIGARRAVAERQLHLQLHQSGRKPAREEVAERRAQAADEEARDAATRRWRRRVERVEVREQRQLVQSREKRSVGVVAADRRLARAVERISGQTRECVAADHVDLRLGLILEKCAVDLILGDG